MILTNLLKNAIRHRGSPVHDLIEADEPTRSVLNVGGGNKQIAIPGNYAGWKHLLLDIAPGPDVDLVLDARNLKALEAGQFDAIYCSHNLEHYFRHDCDTVLSGFIHVLKPEGHVELQVPDMTSVLRAMVNNNLDIDDVLYRADAGPITVHDVIYGWGAQIEHSGVDFYAHKRGFTSKSMTAALRRAGFAHVMTLVDEASFEIRALAFKSEPNADQKTTFGI